MKFIATLNQRDHEITIEAEGDHGFEVNIDGREFQVDCREPSHNLYSLLIDGKSHEVRVHRLGKTDHIETHFFEESIDVNIADPMKRILQDATGARSGEATLEAPMPGQIQRILVSEGDTVEQDQDLLVLVAMKMENALASPVAGKVKKILVAEGDKVESGAPLIAIGE